MRADVWKKLNLTTQSAVCILDAPDSFREEVDTLDAVDVSEDEAGLVEAVYTLAFVRSRERIASVAASLPRQPDGDVIVWFAYPKKTSKRYSCDFSRDSGWEPVGAAGFEAVRQIAIDEDWSALRFRRTEFIRSMKRDGRRALSEEGRARTDR